jgi:hypothetical protein
MPTDCPLVPEEPLVPLVPEEPEVPLMPEVPEVPFCPAGPTKDSVCPLDLV